jgi:glycerate 2-kinase
MYKIIIACDKFKGSLSALEACTWIKKDILSTSPPDTKCDTHPMADGGEGTMAILTDHLGLEAVSVLVRDPLGRMITASYGVNGPEAFIETSVSCGLQLLQPYEQNPMNANTYGVGQMICDAIDRGCKTIHLFVGGSATTDGGAGMAAALGYVFKDEKGDAFVPIGKTL